MTTTARNPLPRLPAVGDNTGGARNSLRLLSQGSLRASVDRDRYDDEGSFAGLAWDRHPGRILGVSGPWNDRDGTQFVSRRWVARGCGLRRLVKRYGGRVA